MTKKRILSAIQPTSQPQLGNYLGALINWVKLQDEYDCFYAAVDLHSITLRHDPKELTENTYTALACYIAAGLDPKKCTLFIQSQVPEHTQLSWVLNCHSYMGELSRMTQFKDKSAKQGANIPAGLFTYPVLMAADILLYQTHLVPVGQDQKQHIELTRDVAERMNNLYKKKLFIIPEPYIAPMGAKIMDLQNPEQKMSKSAETDLGTIFLLDNDKDIEKKIKRSVTDSGSEITFSDDKPGVKNLLTIQSVFTGKSPEALEKEYSGKQYGHLKVDTAEITIQALRPLRENIQKILTDRSELNKILKNGAEKAREAAQKTLKNVYETLGFIQSK